MLASVVGSEGLTGTDRDYLAFADRFEGELINQESERTLEVSMAVGWRLLRLLPVSELTRLSDAQIDRHLERDHA